MIRRYKSIAMIVLAIVFLVACGHNKNNNETVSVSSDTSYDLFFLNQDKTKLVTESVELLPSQELEDMVEILLELLKEGPEDKTYHKTVLDQLVIKDVKIENNTIRLTFGEVYSQMTSLEEVFARAAMVKTLTQLEAIEYVEIYINDQPLKDKSGKPIGLMKGSDFVEDTNSIQNMMQEVTVTLYFANEDATALKAEEVTTTYDSNTSIEKRIVQLLIEGPKTEGSNATLPKETQIKDIYVKDGICYIDFNEEFRSKHWGGSTGEILTIYSIVNSLAELPKISKVQFLINGQKESVFQGHVQFDILFERNLDIIEKEE